MSDLLNIIRDHFGSNIVDTIEMNDEITITVLSINLHKVLLCLRDSAKFKFAQLIDLCGIDYLNQNKTARYAVVYHLLSITNNFRVRVRVYAADSTVPSVVSVWPNADWYEREAHDLFGINFVGHPNLKTLFALDEYAGYPLRKDYDLPSKL